MTIAVINNRPAQNLQVVTATPGEEIFSTQVSTEVLSPTPLVIQPTNAAIPPHTVNGYTATIESAYADTAHVVFQIRITGGDITFGDEYFYDRIGGTDIFDEYGNLINSSGGLGPAIPDPTLLAIKFEPVILLTGDHLKGEFVFNINDAPEYNKTLAEFHFDFDLPIYSEMRFNPKQVVTANGLEILLDSITVTPTFTQIYVCFRAPTFAPWNIGSDSILQIGEQKATLYNSRLLFNSAVGGDKRGTSEPYWVPSIKDGICMKNGFAIGSDNPSIITLTIPALEADKDAGAILLTNQLMTDYPGMSIRQAYSKYLEEHGNTYKGPWTFTIKLIP